MEAYAKRLQEQLDKDIIAISPDCNPVKGYDICIQLTKECITHLTAYQKEHSFQNESLEINYFKYILPYFYSRNIYFVKLYNLELAKITGAPIPSVIEHEIEETNSFLEKNHSLHKYYYSRQSCQDKILFTRSAPAMDPGEMDHFMEFTCINSIHLGQILAAEQYRDHLKEIILKNNRDHVPEFTHPKITKSESIKWKGSKSEAVELIVSLVEAKAIHINGQPATLAQVKELFENALCVDLKDFHVLDNCNRARKKAGTPYLSKLADMFNCRKDRLLG